jgi:hypothetical protein
VTIHPLLLALLYFSALAGLFYLIVTTDPEA